MATNFHLLLHGVVLVMLTPTALAQSTLYVFDGDSWGDKFGHSVSGAGDVDADGIPDMIVGAWRDDNNGPGSGSARVFSGKDGSVLYTFDGDSFADFFGFSVSGAGDVNGDGHDDLIVGAPFDDKIGPDTGSARVHSGKDGTVLHEFTGDSGISLGPKNFYFGYSVSGAGDVNGDGFADLIVGAPFAEPRAFGLNGEKIFDSGFAFVYSGADGSLMYKLWGHLADDPFGSSHDHFGVAVSGAGDVNGDGFDDVVVGAPSYDTKQSGVGSVSVFSGVDGMLLQTFEGDAAHYELGWSVSGAGDVNADGFADVIAGGATGNIWESSKGIARVYSGIDGAVLHTFIGSHGKDFLGYSVSGAGDVNGDGFDDLVVGVPFYKLEDRGSVQIRSGKDGKLLQLHVGADPDDLFGISVAGAGDVNEDGFADVVVGSFRAKNTNGASSGRAYVFSGCSPLGTSYCTPAVVNSTGVPGVIGACGSPEAARDYFMLRATDLPANQFGYFLASQTQGFLANPGGSQGNLCLGGSIGRFDHQVQNTGSAGLFTVQVDLTGIPTSPPHEVQPGETWNFQAWYRDVNPTPTSNFTDGVSVTFQ